jgi:hypothetical protein
MANQEGKEGYSIFYSIKPSAHNFGHPTTITYLPTELEQRLKQYIYLSKYHSALHIFKNFHPPALEFFSWGKIE